MGGGGRGEGVVKNTWRRGLGICSFYVVVFFVCLIFSFLVLFFSFPSFCFVFLNFFSLL